MSCLASTSLLSAKHPEMEICSHSPLFAGDARGWQKRNYSAAFRAKQQFSRGAKVSGDVICPIPPSFHFLCMHIEGARKSKVTRKECYSSAWSVPPSSRKVQAAANLFTGQEMAPPAQVPRCPFEDAFFFAEKMICKIESNFKVGEI